MFATILSFALSLTAPALACDGYDCNDGYTPYDASYAPREVGVVGASIWVEGYTASCGMWTPGFYRAAYRPGYVWVDGYVDGWGLWVPGFWRVLYATPRVAYVAPRVYAAPRAVVVAPRAVAVAPTPHRGAAAPASHRGQGQGQGQGQGRRGHR